MDPYHPDIWHKAKNKLWGRLCFMIWSEEHLIWKLTDKGSCTPLRKDLQQLIDHDTIPDYVDTPVTGLELTLVEPFDRVCRQYALISDWEDEDEDEGEDEEDPSP